MLAGLEHCQGLFGSKRAIHRIITPTLPTSTSEYPQFPYLTLGSNAKRSTLVLTLILCLLLHYISTVPKKLGFSI